MTEPLPETRNKSHFDAGVRAGFTNGYHDALQQRFPTSPSHMAIEMRDEDFIKGYRKGYQTGSARAQGDRDLLLEDREQSMKGY